jgi:STE24 endopeptidase
MRGLLAVGSLMAAAVVGALAWGFTTGAQPVPARVAWRGTQVDSAWSASLPRDPAAATAAFLARVPADVRARGDAFGKASRITLLANAAALVGSIVIVMFSGAGAGMRDLARRLTSRGALQDAIVAVQTLAVFFLLSLPVATYDGFVRLRHAGLSRISYASWLSDAVLNWAVTAPFIAVGVVAFYALIRRRPQSWAVWATGVYALLASVFILLTPQYIAPLFNSITPMADGPQKQAILSLARANGVPANDVFVQNASRQSELLNAHVSGFGGTAQIVLDDNTIAKTPDAEVRLVMAHEIGHYVLAHVTKGIVFDTLITGFGFLFVGWGTTRLITRFGDRWNVTGLRDIGAFPVFWGLLMLWGFLALPLSNSLVREQEAEADMYGINASQQPLGLAEFMIRDADARQLDPSPLVESFFYNHPSARNRIFHAMRWRAEHLKP